MHPAKNGVEVMTIPSDSGLGLGAEICRPNASSACEWAHAGKSRIIYDDLQIETSIDILITIDIKPKNPYLAD